MADLSHAGPPGAAAGERPSGASGDADSPAVDYHRYAERDKAGLSTLHLMVEGVHCGGCVQRIERRLGREADVAEARVNLTTKRLVVRWKGPSSRADALAQAVNALGFRAVPFRAERLQASEGSEERTLLRAMAVAGFAAANVMLLSVSVWSGHAQGMGEATRALLHWFSALIVLPAVLYAGRPFFRSALGALRHGHTNMDVPISLAVLLACAMSLFETVRGGPHVYFDSAIMLLFFLLVGRYLDRRARGRARSAAQRLLALRAQSVTVLDADGNRAQLPPDEVTPGMMVLAEPGQRIAVDGEVAAGRSDVDTSLISGETLPSSVGVGDRVFAGTLNQSAALKLRVTAVGEDTLLGEIVRLMEVAEQRKSRTVDLADRIARLYAPAVHALALATFLGWTLIFDEAWQVALLHAIAVLIITCPCALALAVPAVQVIASGRLMRRGILLKSASALQRLNEVDTVVFDKTGTLTTGRLDLSRGRPVDSDALRVAASLAGASRHPLARALRRTCPDVPVADGVREEPGCGLEWQGPQGRVRLGRRDWCGATAEPETDAPEIWLDRPGEAPVRFAFDDVPRDDAGEIVGWLRARGYRIELLSGDREPAVAAVAAAVGIDRYQSGCHPADKVARLEALAAAGRKVLMIGDGLNDSPALAAAHVSLSPASAADIAQTAADAVFQGEHLAPVREALGVARRAEALVRQNFSLAFGYNVLAIPLAVLGFVTPMIAALSMSASSLVVVGNALRLGGRARR